MKLTRLEENVPLGYRFVPFRDASQLASGLLNWVHLARLRNAPLKYIDAPPPKLIIVSELVSAAEP
jgi:hypothetical protein